MGQFVLGTNVNLETAMSVPIADAPFSALGSMEGNWNNSSQPIYSQASNMVEGSSGALVEGALTSNVPLPSATTTADRSQDTATANEEEDMGSSSNSDSDESGSESDDEMSENEGSDSSAEEEAEDNMAKTTQPLPSLAPRTPTGSSGLSSAQFFGGEESLSFQGESDRGFFNDDDFLSRLQNSMVDDSVTKGGSVGDMSCDPASKGHWSRSFQTADIRSDNTGHVGKERGSVLDSQLQQLASITPASSNSEVALVNPTPAISNVTSTTSTVQPHSVTPSIVALANSSASHSVLSHQHSLDSASRSTGGKKRKLERQTSLNQDSSSSKFQPHARKTPRTSNVRRRGSSLSCFSVSSDSSESSSESSDEQSEAERSPAPPTSEWIQSFNPPLDSSTNFASSLPSSTTPVPPSFTSSVTTSSVTTSHQAVTPKQPPPFQGSSSAAPPQQRQLEAGELEDEETEDKWEEGEIASEIENLWVKIPLVKVNFQRERKPKVINA